MKIKDMSSTPARPICRFWVSLTQEKSYVHLWRLTLNIFLRGNTAKV